MLPSLALTSLTSLTSLAALALLLSPAPQTAPAKGGPMEKSEKTPGFHGFTVKTIDGSERSLGAYRGRAVLVVNTASQCGYTPQYAGLEAIYQKYKNRGFAIAAFPSNDFGEQEPGTDGEIKSFCTLKYKTTFDLYSKIPVKAAAASGSPDPDGRHSPNAAPHPLYAYLTSQAGVSGGIRWNFTKFLVDTDGKVVARFEPNVAPEAPELVARLESILPRK